MGFAEGMIIGLACALAGAIPPLIALIVVMGRQNDDGGEGLLIVPPSWGDGPHVESTWQPSEARR